MNTPEERRALAYIERLSSRLEGPLREAVRRAARTLPTQGARGRLAALLAAGDVAGAADYLSDHPDVVAAWTRVRHTYSGSVIAAAQTGARSITAVLGITVPAPVVNDAVLDAVRRWGDDAFRRIRADAREAVREVVVDAIAEGSGPRRAAQYVTQRLGRGGLTGYDARLVRSFREQLTTDPARALRRTLRDKRHDKALASAKPLTPDRIDRMTAAYERKLAAWRAQTIARTAALQAANEGQLASWREAVAAGSVRAEDVRRYWVVADDERMCTICAPVPDMNARGVGLDELFSTPIGSVWTPTLHPNCRCTTWTRVERRAFDPAPTPGIFRARGP